MGKGLQLRLLCTYAFIHTWDAVVVLVLVVLVALVVQAPHCIEPHDVEVADVNL